MTRDDDRKTIIFCCNSLWGLVNFRGRIIAALARDGHRVVLVARRDAPLEQVSALGAEFLEWHVLPRSTNLMRELAAIHALHNLYRRIGPDIAFHFTIKPVMYGAIVSRMTGVPCVSVITGLGYLFLDGNWKTRAANTLYRMTLHRSREVWFLNGDDRAAFASNGLTDGLQVRTLPGEGIDVDRFACMPLPPSNRRFIFLMIARLVKDKGVVEFADAASRVRAVYSHAVFRLLGPPYSANAMSVPMSMIESWTREGHVEYLGAVDDVRPAIAESQCVVLPSYREGIPRVLMEAAAMGRPVIATDVPGCRDVVRAGETGLLCQPKDVDSLTRACTEVLSMSRNELEAMGRRARASTVQRYDDRTVIAIYREAISTLSGRHRAK